MGHRWKWVGPGPPRPTHSYATGLDWWKKKWLVWTFFFGQKISLSCDASLQNIKEIECWYINILSSFTHPRVIQNLYNFFITKWSLFYYYSAECKIFCVMLVTKQFSSHWLPLYGQKYDGTPWEPKLFGYYNFSKYLLGFITIWRWLNDDKIFIFGWTIYFIVSLL